MTAFDPRETHGTHKPNKQAISRGWYGIVAPLCSPDRRLYSGLRVRVPTGSAKPTRWRDMALPRSRFASIRAAASALHTTTIWGIRQVDAATSERVDVEQRHAREKPRDRQLRYAREQPFRQDGRVCVRALGHVTSVEQFLEGIDELGRSCCTVSPEDHGIDVEINVRDHCTASPASRAGRVRMVLARYGNAIRHFADDQ